MHTIVETQGINTPQLSADSDQRLRFALRRLAIAHTDLGTSS